MADDVTVDNGGLTDYVVATDDDGSGNQIQLFKIVQSANASRTPVTADSDGLLVNLGTNNDVSLNAGTNAIGKLAANSGVDIGDVDVTTVVPGTGATQLGKAVDSVPGATDTGVAALAVRDDALGTLTPADGDYTHLRTNDRGAQWVVHDGNVTVNAHAVTNAGTFVTQENGSALTALQLIDDTVFADDAAFTVGTSKVNAIGAMADESSTDSVDEGDVGIPRMTLDRKLIVTVEPHTAGGWDVFMASSGDGSTALTNSAQAVKASAGKLGGWYIYNPNSSATYVIIYNTASGSVTVGTTNPKMVVCIPATSGANVEFVNGITFDTAIAVAATTTGGGNSAPSTALEANFLYK